ncbi:Lsr2 dimerization domain-containing protein [Pseudonocardia pini]|uniref:Lsr2 dimerization domain-containing protein n=1 Tax=Pseudonocardia pini TaxID=2758030 RepID=UPI0015F0DECA|nr:histone-like nucleoid-structuring protein Lsr2 [Pseudonocardia pini]
MGVREIRYCDISGVEGDVESHVVHVDQMRIEIDLAGPEYKKLLDKLRPYVDAGRVEASVPNLPGAGRSQPKRSTSTALTAEQRQQVRDWAEEKGIEVPTNNRFKATLVEQWRKDTTPDPED